MFINRGMDKDVVHTHTMEYYSALKKNEIILFVATQMDLEIITLSEVRQRQISYHFFMESFKMIQMN